MTYPGRSGRDVKRRFRLTRSTDFKRVRREGKSYAHPLVVLIALPNDREQTRVGVAAGRSVGGAVKRNRAKRIMRTAIDPLLSGILPGHDLVVLARRPIIEVKSQKVHTAIKTLLSRAGLLIEGHDI